MTADNNLFPLMLDLTDKKIVIFGSGMVAERKVKLFSKYTNVIVINHHFSSAIKRLSSDDKIQLVKSNIEQLSDDQLIEQLSDVFLVIPATSDIKLNQKLTLISNACGALVNQVDSVGEVVIPSVITQGDITIGVSTNGVSPALSKFCRKKIEQQITPDYGSMAVLQKEMRDYYKLHIEDQQLRKKMLWDILNNQQIWDALAVSYEQAIKMARELT